MYLIVREFQVPNKFYNIHKDTSAQYAKWKIRNHGCKTFLFLFSIMLIIWWRGEYVKKKTTKLLSAIVFAISLMHCWTGIEQKTVYIHQVVDIWVVSHLEKL